jgi:hypothetical protein
MSGWWFWGSKNPEERNEERLARVVDELAEKICRGHTIDWDSYVRQSGVDESTLRELAGAIDILVDFGTSERKPD